MADYGKVIKGALSAVKGTQEVLPAAQREANKAKFLAESKDPRRMYHATGMDFKQFLPGGQSQAVFVTPEAKFAEDFALNNFTTSQGSDKFQAGTQTMPVRVQVKNPFDYENPAHIRHLREMARKRFPGNQQVMDEIEAMGLFEHNWPSVEHPDIQRLIKQGGYDSFYSAERGTKNLGIYDPRKVKSEIGNRGTFDVTNPDITKRRGGPVRMQAGGALNVLKMLAKGEDAASAAQRAAAGRRAADVIKATEPMKMSEALGGMNVEGKGVLKVTQSDRTRVGGGNIGGAMFPGLQQVDPIYEGAVWGVGNKPTASGLIRQSDENTLWSTLLGSADQLKTNPLVFNKLRKGFTDAMKEGKLSDELAEKINKNLALKFGEGADIRDPKIWQKADTFDKRALLADLMMGQGVAPGKGGVALGGEKSGKGVIFQPTEILKRETEPLLMHPEFGGDVPTFSVGPRLFTLSGEVKQRPDLHPGFPIILQGEDRGLVFKPAPGEIAMRDYYDRFVKSKGRAPGYYDWTLGEKGIGLPSQLITDKYLTHLQKAGFAEGGNVDSFSARLKAGLEQYKAVGGAVNLSDTRPDVTDSEARIAAPFYKKGGGVQRFDGGGYAEPLAAPDAPVDPLTRKAFANLMGKGREQLGKEFRMLMSDPAARADILKRIGLQTAGGGSDLLNLLASGVDIAQEQIPALRKPASVLDPSGKTLGFQPKAALSSEEPTLGSAHLIRKAQEAGLLGENEAPITEILGSIALGAGAANPAKVRGGLNTMTAASRRPFTPATVTMEAVAPDLAKFKPRDWQETTTRRLISGEGAPVSMSTVGGQRTTKRPGQGVYFNDPDDFGVRQLETNPMVAVDVPAVGSMAKNQAFRRDISQAGKELGQESVAAHRFLPMLSNTMADANAVLIKPSKGTLSNEQAIELGRMLGGDMVVAHNPRLGGVVVYPFPFKEVKGMPGELVQATQAAKTILGEGANLRYGRVHPTKDTTYIPRADYAKEGAGEPSAASVAMRERLKKGEARLFREREKSTQ